MITRTTESTASATRSEELEDADVVAVMADLSAQVHEWFGSEVDEEIEELAGARRHVVRDDQAGGSKLDLAAVTVGDRTWITVATGYD